MTPDDKLRTALIKLAHQNPDGIREKILPILASEKSAIPTQSQALNQATVSLHVSLRALQGMIMKMNLEVNNAVRFADKIDPETSQMAQDVRKGMDEMQDRISALLVHIN